MSESEKSKLLQCSFCGKSQRDAKKLIAGPTVYICDECVFLCNDIIAQEKKPKSAPSIKLPLPEEIRDFLNNYVIGQDETKKTLAVAVYNHYKRINAKTQNLPVEIQKSNILLIGPTGTGKTLLAQSLAKLLKVPFSVVDATTLTQAGYVGEDVESILQNLLAMADNNLQKAEQGIIYIDEIDKISRRSEGPSQARDVSGEGVQQSLLKLIEGTKINIFPRGTKKFGGQEPTATIDTSNILFICGGAFAGLDQIIQRRIGKKNIGFSSAENTQKNTGIGDILSEVCTEDLVMYGLIPEFIGRLPAITTLDDIKEKDLVAILQEPKNALVKQYQKLFSMEGVKLNFTDTAIAAIASQSIKKRSGARGLRAVMESSMLEIMYNIPFLDNIASCTITEDVILGGTQPELTFHNEKKNLANEDYG